MMIPCMMGVTSASSRLEARLVPETQVIPGGRFRMGSTSGRSDERPVHDVVLRGFCISRTAVTRAEYALFLAAGHVTPPRYWGDPAFAGPDPPVVGVSWFDAVAYTRWLSAATGRCFRLPSEAEWERAARGGLEQAPTTWGESLPRGEVPAGPLEGPWPVGRGTPNGFGLLDMGTIVHEWCADWYAADYYAVCGVWHPRGPEEGSRRVSRGGAWRHRVRWSSPSARSSLPPDYRYADYGFRVAEDEDEPSQATVSSGP